MAAASSDALHEAIGKSMITVDYAPDMGELVS
jgi:hypothetical protein